MKYIKLFENLEYKVGDYVKIKMIPDYSMYKFNFTDADGLFTKIIEVNRREDKMRETDYKFEFPDGKFVYGYVHLIRRKMTKKEIEEYELRKEANKYNL